MVFSYVCVGIFWNIQLFLRHLFIRMCTVNSNIQSPVGQRTDASNVLFPWILRVFDLKAIDFFKVLDSFVHAESHLAPEIIKVFFQDIMKTAVMLIVVTHLQIAAH